MQWKRDDVTVVAQNLLTCIETPAIRSKRDACSAPTASPPLWQIAASTSAYCTVRVTFVDATAPVFMSVAVTFTV